MLYGPPGTGKTSFIKAIAGNLKLNICILSLNNMEISEEYLVGSLENVP